MKIISYQHPRWLASRATTNSPWRGLEDELDRVVNSAFSTLLPRLDAGYAWSHPRADFYEDKDNFYFRAELPGLKKDDVRVELGDGVLTVSGARKGFAADGAEETANEFSRSVSVPARVKDESIVARYEDGILTVTLPKAEEVKPKRITVQIK